ncbi:MFS transporter [Kosakonia sacchari]|uniref:MFS transporter n=1 Tax=Kosakonia sacchari TaxID=1158459 RepID=UPI000BE5197B|nr:MFS transporter [Kosakonia sacchari]PDO85889.1 MFS transporter [Kosakonia sacchari]
MTTPHPATNTGAQHATRGIFFIAGLAVSAWAPLIPLVKATLHVDDGALGLLLFCIAAGSMLAMPFSGSLISRFGCRAVILCCALVLCLDLPVMLFIDSPVVMGGVLLFFGAANGLLDVSMNSQAVVVERESGQARMAGFHSFYSLGCIAGAGSVSLLLWAGVAPRHAILLIALLILAIALASSGHLLARRPQQTDAKGSLLRTLAHPHVLFIAIVCFFIFLIEGAMLDWSAVFLHSERQMPAQQAGLGFTLYSIAVALGRVYGDRLINTCGNVRVLLFGGVCAAAGLLVMVSLHSAMLSLAGFVLVGAGLANIVPVLFSGAGNQPGVPSHFALPAVTLFGYAGLLSGPALIGAMAQHFSLSAVFSAGIVLLLLVSLLARNIIH